MSEQKRAIELSKSQHKLLLDVLRSWEDEWDILDESLVGCARLNKAEYKKTYEKVCLKLKPTKSQCEQEIKILLTLPNENILRLLGTSQLYLVFQKCVISLDCVLADQEKTFTTHDGLRVVVAVAQGLAFLHERGYVHRDVCRQNVVFTEKKDSRYYEPKIASLETVCKASEAQKQDDLRNVPIDSTLTPKSDVWSLGVLTFELFTRWTEHNNRFFRPESLQSFSLGASLSRSLSESAHERPEANQVARTASEDFDKPDVPILQPIKSAVLLNQERNPTASVVNNDKLPLKPRKTPRHLSKTLVPPKNNVPEAKPWLSADDYQSHISRIKIQN